MQTRSTTTVQHTASTTATPITLYAHTNPGAPVGRCKGPEVPHPQGVVHGIGQQVVSVWADFQPSDCVAVARQFEGHCTLTQLPHRHLIVQATAVHLQEL